MKQYYNISYCGFAYIYKIYGCVKNEYRTKQNGSIS